MCATLVCAPILWAGSAASPDRDQLVWQGTLQGTHDLIVRNATVIVQDIAGPPATNITYRFTTPLPKEDLTITVDPRTTRGYVHIVQQPKMENDYTLQVRVEDRQDGPVPYTLALSWPREGPGVWSELGSWPGSANPPFKKARVPLDLWATDGQRPKITCRALWTGDVRDTVRLQMRDGKVTIVGGDARGRFDLIKGTVWPKRAYHPVVLATSAETQARIVEQPDSRNGFATVVEVQAKSALVNIEIAW